MNLDPNFLSHSKGAILHQLVHQAHIYRTVALIVAPINHSLAGNPI